MHSQSSTEGQTVQEKTATPPPTADPAYKEDGIGTTDIGTTPPADGQPVTDPGT